jgi:TolB protein
VFVLLVTLPTTARATAPGQNGRRIAFSTDQSARPQIFSVRTDGTGTRQLTHVPKGFVASSPDWSPDGRRILYDSNVTGDQELWVMKADGSHQRQLTHDPRFADQHAQWSPDGSTIVFERCGMPFGFIDYCDIDLMWADGSHRMKIVGGRWMNAEPGFSPDASQIVFDSNRAGFIRAIWRADVDGSGVARLTPPLLEAFYPDWSPDGRHILFSNNNDRPHSDVWQMRPDGTHLTQITNVPQPFDDAFATFSPNGRKILFASNQAYPDGCCTDLYVMDRDGSGQTPVVTNQPGAFFSDWQPRRQR